MVTKEHQEDPIIRPNCRTRRGLELIADQWSMLVIVALGDKTKRFSQLHAHIEGISKKMLAQVLHKLERNGLVKRVVYPVIPPMVEYSLTRLGLTLREPIDSLRNWSEKHIEEVELKREEYDLADHTLLQDEIIALVQQRAAKE
jgi:DNA-binding HxlR family transcriptional regulator